jgi:peptidyl-prolyl cis-trans isomerase B (cyclophilin B)
VPTNQQRRDAAKRKLERQLQRREQQDRARRQRLVIIGVVAAVLVISGGVWLFVSRDSSTTAADASATEAATGSAEVTEPTTPCSYPAAGTAAKDVSAPTNLEPLNTGTVESTIVLNGQDVPVSLNREAAPCGVNAFLSLASQGFYDNTECHRLTVSEQLNILQCGDPSGQGNGGPGYSFATEVAGDATYPVGTVALANAGADTNGSQFFIVYGNTTLSPAYTILGTVTGEGMREVDEIAAQGVQKGAQEGPPNATATIARVTVPDGALEGTGTYETATPSDSLGTDGVIDPGAVDPGAVDPGAVDPGAVDPGAVDPGAVDPGAGDTGEPTPAGDPAATSGPGAG